MTTSPLNGLLVVELAGLAPGPFTGKCLADWGARVLRVDRHLLPTSQPTDDPLAEHKRSIRIDLKSTSGAELFAALCQDADVLIDPFRPGVLENLGLGPSELCVKNPKLIYARLSGFRRDGKYKNMAGHDINYIAVSGALSLLGREHSKPQPPANILGDFAGGGMVCFLGILLAIIKRHSTRKGQVVEANMVDGSAFLTTFPRYSQQTPLWCAPRGSNLLDGGAPFYDTYETRDGGFMAVGALEERFYTKFVELLLTPGYYLPSRSDRRNWAELRNIFEVRFREKDRSEWEAIFDGEDACVTPVKTNHELLLEGFSQNPIVALKDSPAIPSSGWVGSRLKPGEGFEAALQDWWGWKPIVDWTVSRDGLCTLSRIAKSHL